jgi:hypothetical protein
MLGTASDTSSLALPGIESGDTVRMVPDPSMPPWVAVMVTEPMLPLSSAVTVALPRVSSTLVGVNVPWDTDRFTVPFAFVRGCVP